MTNRAIFSAIVFSFTLAGCGVNRSVKKGDEHLRAQRPDSAATEYQRVLDKAPSHTGALRGMAAAHLARKQPMRAILPAQRAATAGDAESKKLLVRALLTTGRSEDALRNARSGAESAPTDVEFQMLVVEAMIANGDFTGAADAADEALSDIATAEARSLHTWALLRADRVGPAVAMATEATVMAPEDADIQSLAATVFRQGKRQDDFNRAHKMARALLPASPRDMLGDATWLAEQGDKEGAIRKLAALQGAYPSHGRVSAQLGLLYAEQQAWPRSIDALSAALANPPYKMQATVSGVRKMKTGDITTEVQRRSEVVDIANRLGDAFKAEGRHAEAAQAWGTALARSNQPSADGYLRVANSWEKANNIDEMGKAAQRATELDPTNAGAHFALARAFEKSNNVEWAIRHSQRSWNIDPEQSAVALFLGSLYEARGERRVAREIYRDALRRHPSDTMLYAAFERVGGTRRR